MYNELRQQLGLLSGTARFLTEDTYCGEKDDPLSLNLYRYCAGNPMKYADPSGHVATEEGKMAHVELQDFFIACYLGSDYIPYVEFTVPGVDRNKSYMGFADMVLDKDGIYEVYEIKPGSYAPSAPNYHAGKEQLASYVTGLKMSGFNAKAGGSFSDIANELVLLYPDENSTKIIKYYCYEEAPGMIYYNINEIAPVTKPATLPAFTPADSYELDTRKVEVKSNSFFDEALEAGFFAAALYVGYRVIRMIPSLFSVFWWTIPANAAIP